MQPPNVRNEWKADIDPRSKWRSAAAMMTARVRFVALSLAIGQVGACGSDTETRVVEQSVSPDGNWVAKLVSEHHFGSGTAGDIIRVTLNRKNDDGQAGDVLVLQPADTETYPGQPAKHVSLQWRGPNQLALRFRQATADTIVQRYAGVDITTTEQR
jgi:hypothetical protein